MRGEDVPGRHSRRRPNAVADDDVVGSYLREIGRYPLLSATEERRLAQAMKRGREAGTALDRGEGSGEPWRLGQTRLVAAGVDATNRLITSNLRLVVSIAKQYEWSDLPLADLIQEGNVGLIGAVAGFDHARGFRFSTYAAWPIRRAIVRAIANTAKLVRLPVRAGQVAAQVRRARRFFEDDHGRPPTPDELATWLAMPPARVREALVHTLDPVSLSTSVGDGGCELGDLIEDAGAVPPLEHAVQAMQREELAVAMNGLEEHEHAALRMRFGLDGEDDATLAEVGRRLGMSPGGVRSVQRRAIGGLRRSLRVLEQSA